MPDTNSARWRLQSMFEAHGEKILLYFLRRTDRDSARDGASDTFLVAWRRIDDIPPGRELPWLYGVARRVLSQQRRAHRRRMRLHRKLETVGPDDVPGPETVVLRNAECQEVVKALQRMRPDDQELLQLAIWDELSHSDIAEILRCSPHAVDQRVHRAIRRLARELRASGHIPSRETIETLDYEEEAS